MSAGPSASELVNLMLGKTVRVLLVQQDSLLATETANLLRGSGLELCAFARTGREAASIAEREKADIALIDFTLPDMNGPAAAALMRDSAPEVAIVLHNAEQSETELLDAIDAGAVAYLTKSATAAQLVEAVRRAARGEVLIPVELFARAIARRRQVITDAHELNLLMAQFTPRELEVLQLLAQGLGTNELAERLGIASHTVEWHIRHLIEKLHVHSKLQAVIEAARIGLIDL